ncbi:putative zinc finger protein [Actinomycetospora succinea]|uniref:Putative zinc finger protein n=1 Tax=Actinomycetospora succinea TaxID=663603 RepID=A0A4R6VL12_9PSEU|nr:zf-HC2 domain-containing protein [Actinomycetospora succinea]TDQ62549.1 putative zinc finger protein [Actinomycetospora succinea]
MDCATCREIVSAGLDGEAGLDEESAAAEHLEGCATCRTAADRAAGVTRRVRLSRAAEGPDVVDAVLARVFGDEVRVLPTVTCGCAHTCACGCQDGNPCRCRGAA